MRHAGTHDSGGFQCCFGRFDVGKQIFVGQQVPNVASIILVLDRKNPQQAEPTLQLKDKIIARLECLQYPPPEEDVRCQMLDVSEIPSLSLRHTTREFKRLATSI